MASQQANGDCRFRENMKKALLYKLFGIVFLGFLCVEASAGLLVVNPSKDNSIYAENNNSNATGDLFVGPTLGLQSTILRRALVYFDVSSIPAGSTINSVTLRLSPVIAGPNSGADVLSLHPLSASWGEGTSFASGKGDAPTPNDATWSSRFHNTTAWTTPGGDFALDPSGTVTLDSVSTEFTFASQAGMVSDVENWVNNPTANNGWLLKYEDEVTIGTARAFFSREDSVNLQPTLTIDFTAVPEPSTFMLLGTVIAAASAWRRFRPSAPK
jgi:hypothetical protein